LSLKEDLVISSDMLVRGAKDFDRLPVPFSLVHTADLRRQGGDVTHQLERAQRGSSNFPTHGSEPPMREVFPRLCVGQRGVHLCPPGQPAVAGGHLLEQPTDPIVGSGQ